MNDNGTTTKHTPGPWRAVIRSNQHGPQSVAVDMPPRGAWKPTRAKPGAEDVANARLIAATPDLLAALCEIAALSDPIAADGPAHDQCGAIARAAIAKATGQT